MTGFVVSRPRRGRPSTDAASPERGHRDRDKLLRNTVIECRDAPTYVLEIQKLWDDAAESFLAIGQYLVAAKQTLQHGDFEHMVRQQLPFDRNVAHRLRRVAEAIGNGRLDRSILPRNYTTIYRFVTMDDPTLSKARDEGVMHPTVTHREVTAFLRRARSEAGIVRQGSAELEVEHRRLRDELHELERVIDGKRQRLAEIDAIVGRQPGPIIDGEAVAAE